jgi:protein-tyrosine phosphatase
VSDRVLIDLHCHVLPGIDDGPGNLGEALQLARAAVEAGTRVIVATPHVNHAYPENDAARIAGAVAEFNRMLGAAQLELEVRTGAEVALTRAAELPADELTALRLGGGPFLLVECPGTPSTAGFAPALEAIAAQGHRILLAHAERIPAFQREPHVLEALVDAGMLVQLTAASIAGRFGDPVRDFAQRLLQAGLVHDVASDAHAAERRGPGIAAYLEEAGWGSHVGHFACDVPLAILAGEPIPPMPPPPRRPRRGFLLKRAS